MSTSVAIPAWLASLKAQDFLAYGLPEQTQDALQWFASYDVDFGNVEQCLKLLKSARCILHCGAPLGLMAYCPRRDSFLTSFDTQVDEQSKTAAQASLWLAILAAECGSLPVNQQDWGVVGIGEDGMTLSGANQAAIQCYGDHRPPSQSTITDGFDAQASLAFWRCVDHRLGR